MRYGPHRKTFREVDLRRKCETDMRRIRKRTSNPLPTEFLFYAAAALSKLKEGSYPFRLKPRLVIFAGDDRAAHALRADRAQWHSGDDRSGAANGMLRAKLPTGQTKRRIPAEFVARLVDQKVTVRFGDVENSRYIALNGMGGRIDMHCDATADSSAPVFGPQRWP